MNDPPYDKKVNEATTADPSLQPSLLITPGSAAEDAAVAALWDRLVAGGWKPPTVPSDALTQIVRETAAVRPALACPLCRSTHISRFTGRAGTPLVQCINCGYANRELLFCGH